MTLSLRDICLLGLLLLATVTDVRQQIIPNKLTYPGILLGFVTATMSGGLSMFQQSLIGFLVCGLIMVFCFVLFDIGGGDVKLIAMMGSFLGMQEGIEAMLWTFILGSAMGIAILIWRFGLFHLLKKTGQHLWLVLRAQNWIPPTDEEREPLQRWLFLAPAALIAVLIILNKQSLAKWGVLYN